MRKVLLSAVAAVGIMVTSANAGIDQFMNDAVVQASGGKTIKTDTGTLLYGGGIQMRAKTVNLQPFSVAAPSVKAGCGGIDATLGSLSYLDMDQIVELLQGMMANAPGVMFEMALKVICPSCMDTLNALNDMANQINGINVNSCQATKAASSWMEGYAKDKIGNNEETDFNKMMKKFNSGVEGATTKIGKIASYLSSKGCNPSDKTCGARFFISETSTNSFLSYAMTTDNADPYFSGTNFANTMRYFCGDIVVSRPSGSGASERQGTINILGSELHYDNGEMGIERRGKARGALTDANTQNILKYLVGDTSSATEVPMIRDPLGNSIPMSSESSIKSYFEAKLTSIQSKISSRTALDSNDIGFLGMFDIPVYMITNRLASMPSGDIILNSIKSDLAEMLAYEIVYEYLTRTSKLAIVQREKMTPEIMDAIPYNCSNKGCYSDVIGGLTSMQKGASQAAVIAYSLAAGANKKVTENIGKNANLLANVESLKNYTLQRSNPNLFQSYTFSKAMTVN